MRYYIATSSKPTGIARAKKLRDALTLRGHVWTYDWSQQIEERQARGLTDADLTETERAHIADLDASGVHRADVILYLEDEKSEGAAWEVGYAMGRFKPVYVVAPERPRCLFMLLALGRIFASEGALLTKLDAAYPAASLGD